MITHPTAAELHAGLEAVEALDPSDPRGAFLARVADNARATLDREAALGQAAEAAAIARLEQLLDQTGDFAALNAALCNRLRDGRMAPLDPGLLAHLRASLVDQIAIDQPTYSGLAALGAP